MDGDESSGGEERVTTYGNASDAAWNFSSIVVKDFLSGRAA